MESLIFQGFVLLFLAIGSGDQIKKSLVINQMYEIGTLSN